MAPMLLLLLILTMVGGSESAWCVCKQDANSAALQKTIDYACGAGADCSPLLQNGPCYNPNTVVAHCSYAANSYYQRNGQNTQACDFAGTAQLAPTDPSYPGCTYPATPSAAGSSGNPSTSPATPGSSLTPGSGTSLTPNSPGTGTGAAGTGTVGGTGVLGGLGPSGVGLDGSDAANLAFSLFLTALASAAAAALAGL